MDRSRPSYPPEFKQEAVRLVHASDEDRPIPKIARKLGVSSESLVKSLSIRGVHYTLSQSYSR